MCTCGAETLHTYVHAPPPRMSIQPPPPLLYAATTTHTVKIEKCGHV